MEDKNTDQDSGNVGTKHFSGERIKSLDSRVTGSSQATARPWRVVDSADKRQAGFIRREGAEVGEMAVARVMQGRSWTEQRANAELIVRAVNSYEALVDALQAAFDFYMDVPRACGDFTCSCGSLEHCGICDIRESTRAALALANPISQAGASPKASNPTTVTDHSPASEPEK